MRSLTALAAAAALLSLAGCGGDKKTIPKDDASRLIADLRDVRDLAGDQTNCPDLPAAVRRVQARVLSLPSSVDSDTRETLVGGVNNLIDDVRTECENVQTTPTTPTTPETTPQTTQETAPPTTQQTAPPTTPTTPQTTPTTPTTPGNGNGGTPPGQGGPGNAQGQDKKKGPKDKKKKGKE